MMTRLTRLLLLLFAFGTQAEEITGKVIGVTDGDTLTILVDKAQTKVRLAEIDTPELGQAFGRQAKKALADLAFGKQAGIVVIDRDRYGRNVGRVYVDGLDVNKELVRQGFAWAYLQYQRDASFSDLEAEARAAKRGLWALPKGEQRSPWRWRREGDVSADPSGTGCRIKGNISRNGRKLYHLPDSRAYGPTKIEKTKGERWFCTEEEALAAGWVQP